MGMTLLYNWFLAEQDFLSEEKVMTRNVVITGLGPVTPIGIGKKDFWSSLVDGRSNYSEITRFPLEGWDKIRVAVQINDFDPCEFVDSKVINAIKRQNALHGGLSIYYGVAGAKLALEDSSLELDGLEKDRVGVTIGSGAGDFALTRRADTNFIRGAYVLANALSGIVAKQHGFHGFTMAPSAACATGSVALEIGASRIKMGLEDVMIVGSSEAPIDIPHFYGSEFDRRSGAKGLSRKNWAMVPFGEGRDGPILGEGAGVLVLEAEQHALRRGAHIYARVLGCGTYTDFDTNLVRVTEKGYRSAMERALYNASIATCDLDGRNVYVNAHGTATVMNDSRESKAVFDVVGSCVPVSSFKGTLGHSQAACGGVELIGSALVINNGIIPKTNLEKSGQDCASLDYVTARRDQPVEIVIKNSAGFSGAYASTVLGKL
jgi:3-oxoacyl-[acyl-carrier-protein] synthase II